MIFIINSCIKKNSCWKVIHSNLLSSTIFSGQLLKSQNSPPPTPPALRTVIFTSIKQSLLLSICDNCWMSGACIKQQRIKLSLCIQQSVVKVSNFFQFSTAIFISVKWSPLTESKWPVCIGEWLNCIWQEVSIRQIPIEGCVDCSDNIQYM